MRRLSRRRFLELAAAGATLPALAPLAGCGDQGLPEYDFEGEPGPPDLFQHGVASGDPLSDGVVLWTRVTPARPEPVEVFWEMARDRGFRARVAAGWALAVPERDGTVKVDVRGLDPAATYFYRFRALGRRSRVGRTRTAPEAAVRRVRFAVAACSNYGAGYFHGYRGIADVDGLDAVLHLGDYIYESGGGIPGRLHDPAREIVALDDYRRRYAQHRGDPDLQEAHARHPFIAVWDDHETANNAWSGGAENHQPETEGPWEERRAAAARAYSEWMPIRDQADGRIFRAFSFGDLVRLVMLDTRIWGRDRQAASRDEVGVIRDPGRTLLGFDQEDWLAEQVHGSRAQWFLLGQQIVMTQWWLRAATEAEGGGLIANQDQWDGYHATRARLFEQVRSAGLRNFVVLSGDVHSSWASDLTEDPVDPSRYDPASGRGSLGVELVAPGITSPFPAPGVEQVFLSMNPAIRYADTLRRGYFLLDVDADRADASWRHLDDVTSPETVERTAARWRTRDRASHLEPAA